MNNKGNNSILIIILFLFIILSFILVFRIITLSNNSSEINYTDPVVSKNNNRGTIYDRRGNILALDTIEYGFSVLDSSLSQQISTLISEYTDYSPLEISALIDNENEAFIPLSQFYFNKEEINNLIKEYNLENSIILTTRYVRRYPYASFSSIVGTVDSNKKGTSGIEKSFNSYLKATPKINQAYSNGSDLVLSLDKDYQNIIFDYYFDKNEEGSLFLLNSNMEIIAYYSSNNFDYSSSFVYSITTDGITKKRNIDLPFNQEDCSTLSSFFIYTTFEKEKTLLEIESLLRKNGKL